MFKYRERKQNKKTNSKDTLIQNLIKQVKELEDQVTLLKQELDFEKNKPKDGYEEAKKLIEELEKKKHEYQSLIDELSKLRDSYSQKIKDTLEIKNKYEEKLNELISEIKTGINNKKNKFK